VPELRREGRADVHVHPLRDEAEDRDVVLQRAATALDAEGEVSERLTDEQLAEIVTHVCGAGLRSFVSSPSIESMAAELRQRRAQDLSSEERDALGAFRESFGGTRYSEEWKRALAVLDRLLAATERLEPQEKTP
jgi:hypothetical protein